ncbi:MAG: trypsin-like peptidase domain-containing protein [Steroidobacteraceae bacterium]
MAIAGALMGVAGPTLLLAADAPASSSPQSADADDAIKNSVVKVFATARRPDLSKPWSKQSPQEVTGSGAVIDGNRILTNAHVVQYASQIQIQANQAGDKIEAKLIAITPQMDLAILSVDDPSFFKTHPAIPRAKPLPRIKDAVLAYGYPTGGSSLSITKGIVSRIEFVDYSLNNAGLRVQIDAALNPGNSGGPVIDGDRMIGLAFATQGNNIGYVIPTQEIDLFLEGIAGGHYDGKPAMRDVLQTLENKDLRRFLKLDGSVHGVVVHRPYRSDSNYPLRQWDVITSIGSTPIDDQGMVVLGPDVRVRFQALIQTLVKNGSVPLQIQRAGKAMTVSLSVSSQFPLILDTLAGKYPEYFIYGPIVFTNASIEDLTVVTTAQQQRGPSATLSSFKSPIFGRLGDAPTADLEELVVVPSPFLPHSITSGYESPAGATVSKINGQSVKSLRQMVTLLRDLDEDFVRFDFEPSDRQSLVFDRRALEAATEDILTDNGIRAQASPELLAIWQAKPRNKSAAH